VLVDRITPYEEDLAARLFVRTFYDGAPLEAIGEAMGISRERVRQIQDEALARLLSTHGRAFLSELLRHDGDGAVDLAV
jgi:DNA-directed RNA polymerase sigma subunit (sigma70/sigma32)